MLTVAEDPWRLDSRVAFTTDLRPLEKMIVGFSEGTEMVREQVVGRRDAEEGEARGLPQQAAAAGPFSPAGPAHRGSRHSSTDTV